MVSCQSRRHWTGSLRCANDHGLRKEIILAIYGPLNPHFPEAGSQGFRVNLLHALWVERECQILIKMRIGRAIKMDLPRRCMLRVCDGQRNGDGLLVRVIDDGDTGADWLGPVETVKLLLKLNFIRVVIRTDQFHFLPGSENRERYNPGDKNDEIRDDGDGPRVAGFR